MAQRVSALLALAIAALAVQGCSVNSGDLSEGRIHTALESFPFKYRYRQVNYSGDGAVVAGLARLGRHATYFAVIAGDPRIEGRAIPRQRLPNGRFQHGVDSTHGPGYTTQFVYTPTSVPRISGDIDTAICQASGHAPDCLGL
jgi:hypothetical protein